MRSATKILRNPHFWIILVLFLICIVLHYPQEVPFLKELGLESVFGLSRHALERILFLFPVVYGGIFFGLRGGIVCLVGALGAMLPRVILISSSPIDALLETCLIIAAGGLANWWLENRRREAGRREQALLQLEAAQRELQTYIQVIKENEKAFSALYDVSTVVNKSLDLEEVANVAADTVRDVMNLEVVLVYFLNEERQELELKTYRGASEEFAMGVNRLKVGEGFNGRVAQTGEALLVEDASRDPRLTREIVRREKIQSNLIVPLKAQNKIVGTLTVAGRGLRKFQDDEVQLLTTIGEQIGIAIQKASLYQDSQLAMIRFQELFEKAHDAMWVHDMQGDIINANKADERLTGYTREELIGMNVRKLLNKESLGLAREVRRRLLDGEDFEQPYEQQLIRKDGREAIVLLASSLLETEQTPAFQHIARDITEERRLQENLRLYASHVSKAHEEERKRIARELHDDTIQAIIAVSRRIDNLISKDLEIPKELLENLEGLQKDVDELLIRTRRLTQDLRPPTLEYLGLLPALRELLTQLQEQSSIEVNLKTKGSDLHFTPENELLIYRIVQEALRNIWKHSGATKAEVVIRLGDRKSAITISDNGKGFNVDESLGFLESGKLGLAGMRERAHLLGGTLDIRSTLNSGTKVTLDIPSKNSVG